MEKEKQGLNKKVEELDKSIDKAADALSKLTKEKTKNVKKEIEEGIDKIYSDYETVVKKTEEKIKK